MERQGLLLALCLFLPKAITEVASTSASLKDLKADNISGRICGILPPQMSRGSFWTSITCSAMSCLAHLGSSCGTSRNWAPRHKDELFEWVRAKLGSRPQNTEGIKDYQSSLSYQKNLPCCISLKLLEISGESARYISYEIRSELRVVLIANRSDSKDPRNHVIDRNRPTNSHHSEHQVSHRSDFADEWFLVVLNGFEMCLPVQQNWFVHGWAWRWQANLFYTRQVAVAQINELMHWVAIQKHCRFNMFQQYWHSMQMKTAVTVAKARTENG